LVQSATVFQRGEELFDSLLGPPNREIPMVFRYIIGQCVLRLMTQGGGRLRRIANRQ
jgi:hypothetical protein